MASSLVAQALKTCLSKSARTVSSVSLPHRSFKITPGFSATAARGIRNASVAAVRAEQDEEAYEEPSTESLPTFDSLEGIVNHGVLKAIKDMKITTMSPVQSKVFPLLPELARPYNPQEPSTGPPRDLLVKAKTGTGKTLGFLLPAIQARFNLLAAHGAQAARDVGRAGDSSFERVAALPFARSTVGTLIISPTRELATQIANEAVRLTDKLDPVMRDFGVRLFVGGENKRRQVQQFFNFRNDIVVATPGRLRDLLDSEPEILKAISKTQVLILDEADTLLDMGFRPDIDAIQKELPPTPERQTFLFSATVSRAIQGIAAEMLAPNHKFINCVSSGASPVHAHVPQYQTIVTDASQQLPHIVRLIAHDQLCNPRASKIVLFLPTTKMTQLYADLLRELKTILPARSKTHIYEIHSKKNMESRVRASSLFRQEKDGASILVTSDVSARGVDYPGVTRVIQVGIPGTTEQYIHRVGRTGRAGTKGRGDLVLLPFEKGFLKSLSSVPLKNLTTDELASEVLELAKTHDSDPDAFFADAPQVHAPGSRRIESLFPTDVKTLVEEIDRAIDSFKAKVDVEAVSESFMSLLGSCMSRLSVLGTSADAVVKGLQQWATEGLGLSNAPFVSEALMARLSSGSGYRRSSSSFGSRGSGFGGYGRSQGRDQGHGSHSGSYRSRDEESSGYRSHRGRNEEGGYRSYHGREQDGSGYRSHYSREQEGFGYRSHRGREEGGFRSHYGRDQEGHGYRGREESGSTHRSASRPQSSWMGRGSVSRRNN
ncbi:DEAD-box ATP-dependent RNA helicase 26 [Termitomyces sp. T112]|nr:DEAD-box ATP-dependent RNA helicase 26 [Termitomyces sp. T112]